MSKSAVRVAREALEAGRAALPEYGSRYSRRDYTQPQLFAFLRRHPLGTLVAVHNVTERPQHVSPMALYLVGHDQPVDRISGQPALVDQGRVVLDPYQAVWLTAPDA